MVARRSLIAVLTALAILAATAVACLVILRGEQDHERLEQRRVADLALRRVKEVMQGPLDGLASVRAFFQASQPVSEREFARFARHLFAHPALDAVSFVQEVPQSGRRVWERHHGVRIREVGAGRSLRPARRRAVYDPMTYAIVRRGPAALIGVDIGAEPIRGAALIAAQNTGSAQATAPLRLLRSGASGFLVLLPIYRKPGLIVETPGRPAGLMGFVGSSYRADVLGRQILAGLPPRTRVSIFDGDAPLLGGGPAQAESSVRSLSVAGRRWRVRVDAPAHLGLAGPVGIGLGGVLLSAVAFVLLLGGARRERYAMRLVGQRLRERDRAEADLRFSEERFRSLVEAMADGVVVHAASGEIIDCNPAAERILGLSREQLTGPGSIDPRWQTVREDGSPLAPKERPALRTLATGTAIRGEIMGLRKPDGSLSWISVSTEPLRVDGAATVVSSFTDVTRRLETEHEQGALRRLATLVASEAEPRTVFDAIARETASAFGAHVAGVLKFDEGASFGVIVGAATSDGASVQYGVRLHLDPTTAPGMVAATGRPARLGDGAGEAVHRSLLVSGVRATATMAAPIVVNGRLWGALAVATTERRALPDGGLEHLGGLAEIASLALISSDAREQLATLASTDHLTGLWNRRAFQERLAAELERARRHGRALSVALMDLDHFKLVNDTHGHPAGDRLLAEVAKRLSGLAREGEIIARVGGEEFAWILPEADGSQALAAVDRVRRSIAAEPFAGVGRVTVSIGVCGLEDAGDGADLFRLADVALYWAKGQGRNRVFRYAPDTLELLPAEEQARRLERARTFASVQALARAVDAKDPSTQRHSERVAEMARSLALACGWSAEEAARLHQAGLVHDVGKIGIPDTILLKPGPLGHEEYERVKEHAVIGAAMLEGALAPDQIAWIRGHHERQDGAGYPDGLAGADIPAGAALLSLADAWDAMTVARPYGAPKIQEVALAECRAVAGTQFAPESVAALEAILAPATTSPIAGSR